MPYQLTAASHTHPGRVRNVNEDAVFSYVRPPEFGNDLGLLIVADGIGGHKAGDVASKIATETIFDSLKWFLEKSKADDTRPIHTHVISVTGELVPGNFLEIRLRNAIQNANTKILEYARNNPENAGNLGTTITCALVWYDYIVIANVGDSRGYRLRDNKLEQLTKDHSFVGQLVRSGQLPAEAYYTHPRRNVITRALGQHPEVNIDLHTDYLQGNDVFLLCSDGLWEMIRDDEIASHLQNMPSPENTVKNLITIANANGGTDNISAVIGVIGKNRGE